jgi:hypothetical protein
MPASRWPETTAGDLARHPAVAMFELTDDGLTRAIDWLRGKQGSQGS